MGIPKRARRRGDLARVKAKCRRVRPHDTMAKSAERLQGCSGPCCGNPRKWFNETTMQERRFVADALHWSERLLLNDGVEAEIKFIDTGPSRRVVVRRSS